MPNRTKQYTSFAIRHRISLFVPPANLTATPELHTLLPADVAMHSTRLPLIDGEVRERLAAYATKYEYCVASFGTFPIDAYYTGVTGATYPLGP